MQRLRVILPDVRESNDGKLSSRMTSQIEHSSRSQPKANMSARHHAPHEEIESDDVVEET